MFIRKGSTNISKVTTQADIDEFVSLLNIKSDVVVIKPNWVDGLDCSHTEVKMTEMFLSSLKDLGKKAVFVESYTFWRTDKMCLQGKKEDYFSSEEATLESGKRHWDFFKRMDKWFLEKEGFANLFSKFGAEYINITKEIWSGNVINREKIKSNLEPKYSPLVFPELYSYIPTKLYEFKDSCFISFSKAKLDKYYGVSLSIKNLFGLIPDPSRAIKYHKDDDKYLIDAIVDVHKIYQSLFDMRFVVDGVFTACLMDFDNNMTTPYKDWGVIIGGKDGLEVDIIGRKLMKGEFKNAMKELSMAYKTVFGGNADVNITGVPSDWVLKGE
ncbi:DUF362 domain-containing protein [Patescibacteria group bacterium]|nr:DUF362 domain-containing protein [Patescibacteria group bacterium]